ncbi:MAG: helix-turn-helix domain-containing protein [Victivallales bacterium]|nr:helix-turn-helix domain-containing protein [Victivallales bacterium]
MLDTQQCNQFNHHLSRLPRYQEMFTLGDFFVQPQVLHFSHLDFSEHNPWHSHQFFEYSILLEGRMRYMVSKWEHSYEAGDVFVIPPNTLHRWDLLEPSIILGLMLHISTSGDGARRRLSTLQQNILRKESYIHNLRDAFSAAIRLQNLLENPHGFLNEKVHYLTGELVIALFDILVEPEHPTSTLAQAPHLHGESPQTLINSLEFFINDNIYRRLTVTELAAQAGISVNHLNNLLKKERGITANELLWQRKLFYAKQLLDTTNRQVKDIAAAIGVEDTGYFCRRFQLFTGQTPAAYRLHKHSL